MNRQSQFKFLFPHLPARATYGRACGHGEPTVEAGGGRQCMITRSDPISVPDPISDPKIGLDPFPHGDRSPFHPLTPGLLP